MLGQTGSETNSGRDEVVRMFLKNQNMVAGFLFSLTHDWDLVDDAMQETTLYIFSHWNEFKSGTNFGAWVRTVARMRCRDLLWSKRRSDKLLRDDFDSIVDLLSDEDWDRKAPRLPQKTKFLDLCMKSLPEGQRRLIEMLYWEEKTHEQLATHLETSIDTVYTMIGRIRKRLKLCLERRIAEESA